MNVDLLIEGGCLVTVNPQRDIITDASIAVKDGVIVAVDKGRRLDHIVLANKRLDARGKLVLPGFVDSHNHPVHFLSQGLSDDAPMYWRLANRIWPFERAITSDEAYSGALGNFATMLLMGTTCFVDPGGSEPEAVTLAARDIGIRGMVARSAQDKSTAALPIPVDHRMSTEEAVSSSIDFYDRWNGQGDGLLRVSFSLRDAQTTSDELCQQMYRVAEERRSIVQMHLVTNEENDKQSRSLWGAASLERLTKLGILGEHLSLVHLGRVSREEAQRLADTNTNVVHCPSASMTGGMGAVGSGGFLRLFEAGVRVSLGTDAAAISRFLDMIRVMYLAATAHKDIACDPLAAGCYKALEMATIEGARAIHLDHQIGSLEVGKQADIVVLDMDGPAWQPDPYFNPVANLVYAADASSVRHVIVRGQSLVEDRVLLVFDCREVWEAARAARQALLSRLGIELTPQWPVS